MGLDQYGYSREPRDPVEYKTTWRKFYPLQNFMENLFKEKGYDGTFNCQELELNLEDIKELKKKILNKKLLEEEGNWDCKEDKWVEIDLDNTLEFCEWALGEIENKRLVYYDCWW